VAGQGSRWTLGNVASTVLLGVTLIASFFLTGEGTYPGEFFVERQALWSGGTYGVKLTFLLTWATLFALAALPLVIVLGSVALARRLLSSPAPVPAGWDVQQVGRRVLMAASSVVLLVTWLGVTGVVVLSPESLSPLGGFAAISLLVLPALPLVPVLLFEAVIPPSYVEGAIEGMQLTSYKDQTTLHLHVAGRRYSMKPSLTEGLGLAQGTRVALIASGFLKSVRRIARVG
jgi:hypothetical protein